MKENQTEPTKCRGVKQRSVVSTLGKGGER